MTQSDIFEKINKTDKALSTLNTEKTQIELKTKRQISPLTPLIQKIIRDYYKQLYNTNSYNLIEVSNSWTHILLNNKSA